MYPANTLTSSSIIFWQWIKFKLLDDIYFNLSFKQYQPSTLQSSCIDCPAGAYCPNTLMTATQPCPVGYYCPSNSYFTGLGIYYEAILCPLGTYNDLQSKTQLSDCKAWPAGNYKTQC